MTESISPASAEKSPSGMIISLPRSAAQRSTSSFKKLEWRSVSPMIGEPSGTLKRNISMRPLAKLLISMAEGNRINLMISLAAAYSGLMVIEMPKTCLI